MDKTEGETDVGFCCCLTMLVCLLIITTCSGLVAVVWAWKNF